MDAVPFLCPLHDSGEKILIGWDSNSGHPPLQVLRLSTGVPGRLHCRELRPSMDPCRSTSPVKVCLALTNPVPGSEAELRWVPVRPEYMDWTNLMYLEASSVNLLLRHQSSVFVKHYLVDNVYRSSRRHKESRWNTRLDSSATERRTLRKLEMWSLHNWSRRESPLQMLAETCPSVVMLIQGLYSCPRFSSPSHSEYRT
ncbi:hypothetical protein BJX61DRAFT_495815 [Aspergillus egyptiacus]|nr:hypothetical protein BJX61DRAFT_495815 [Aspergillus egyptiacus]